MEWTTPAFELSALSASRREQLQRIDEAGLVAQGRVFLLSLEPIKLQMGSRWTGRAEVIWEAVERSLHKRMPPPDVFVRLNDTTVIVAVASTNSYEGQIRCVEILQSLLFHFLGRFADADIALSRIASIDGEALRAEPVDVSREGNVRTGGTATPAPIRQPQDWTPPLTERRASGALKLTHQGRTGYDIGIAPVWRLDLETISAYAVRLRLDASPERLSDLDQEALSHLVIDHLLPILQDYRRGAAGSDPRNRGDGQALLPGGHSHGADTGGRRQPLSRGDRPRCGRDLAIRSGHRPRAGGPGGAAPDAQPDHARCAENGFDGRPAPMPGLAFHLERVSAAGKAAVCQSFVGLTWSASP